MLTYAYIALVVLAWGSNYVLMKLALVDIGPLAFTTVRVFGAAVVTGLMLVLAGKRLWPERRERLPLALIGLLQVSGTLGFAILGLQWVSAGRAAVLVYTMQFWTVPLGLVLFGQWPTLRRCAGALVGVAGLLVFFNPTLVDWSRPHAVLGHALLLCAAISWALGACIYAQRRWASSFEAQTFWQLLLAAFPLAAGALVTGEVHARWTPTLLAIMAFNWVIATAIAYWCWSRALATKPGVTVQAVTLTPLVGYGLSAATLGEPLGWDAILSIALISGGLLLTLRSSPTLRRA